LAITLGTYTLVRDKDRLFDRMNRFLLSTSAVIIATYAVIYNRVLDITKGNTTEIWCKQIDHFKILVPTYGFIDHALRGTTPETIDIGILKPQSALFTEWAAGLGKGTTGYKDGFKGTSADLIGPIFVEYYEAFADWLFKNIGHQDKWPEEWRFGRVVRNAISHGGLISFQRSKKERPVIWYNLTYSESDSGREIFGVDLAVGDLLILLFEMNAQLDALGCPFMV
jgi:hypothetical protein